MRIRKKFVPVAHNWPVSITDQRSTSFRLEVDTASQWIQKVPDKTTLKGCYRSIEGPDEENFIATGLYWKATKGSRNAIWRNQEQHKEVEEADSSSTGRCIMCGEAGHSCFQQLATSHRPQTVDYCCSESGIFPDEVPTLQKLEDTGRGERGQLYFDIHDGPDEAPMSRLRKERYGKHETTTMRSPRTYAHNDDVILDGVNGNKFRRITMNDISMAGKRTHKINAPNKSQRKSTSCTTKQPRSDNFIAQNLSDKDRLTLKDSVLQSGMALYEADTKGIGVHRKPSNEGMLQGPRASLRKRAISRIADRGKEKFFLQELFNRQDLLGPFSAVSNTSEDLKSSSSDPKADVQPESDVAQSSLKQHRHLYTDEEENAGLWAKSFGSEVNGYNLESTTNQVPSDAHNPGYRCKRMDGKGWQCLRKAKAGFSLCEYHLSRFRANHIRRKASKIVEAVLPSEPDLSGRKRPNKKSSGTMVADQVVASSVPQPFQRKRKPMKARSIMSIH